MLPYLSKSTNLKNKLKNTCKCMEIEEWEKMPNLPNNQIILDQSNRGNYPLEDIETWETGAHLWRSLQKDNPSYFHAIPHKDGHYSTEESQANGHYTQIINSSKITQQDSATDGTTNNKQTQIGGGERCGTGQGCHAEHGADLTQAIAGSQININKGGFSMLSRSAGHHGVLGDYGFYVKGGGYSIGAQEQVVVTSQSTIHMEAQSEVSFKGIKNLGMSTKGKMTLDAKQDILANTSTDFTANAAQNVLVNAGQNLTANCGQVGIFKSGSTILIQAENSMLLKVGDSYIQFLPDKIIMESARILVNHVQLTPTSNIFL